MQSRKNNFLFAFLIKHSFKSNWILFCVTAFRDFRIRSTNHFLFSFLVVLDTSGCFLYAMQIPGILKSHT